MDYGLLRFVPGIQRHFFFQLRRDFGSSCGNQLILHAISREPRRMPRRLGTASLDFTVHLNLRLHSTCTHAVNDLAEALNITQ